MVKKTIILLVLYFFLKIYLTSLRRKEYFAKEPGVFGPLEPKTATPKKIPGAGAAWEKNQEPEPEPLEKKSGDGAAKKFAGSPALEDRK